ncbi:hypothetical protein HELRODRAFT_194924 [Helobdella robusta]|uniref:Receptor expression-enhancing protein n=1 Tax=Helobdella robusta TaxID=6412 RepID=T1FWK6_HELRO|nr:hypothetical protein HELRODRAFT_194924 [Helobdella robusta]ESO10453.1 hypothetical protein HELRODRAFT_194924 [Helobdella robusta]
MMPSSVVARIFELLVGFVYPSYQSYKAIQQRDSLKYTQWLIYWIVFSLFLSVEKFSDPFVLWIPFYYETKILTLLWLVSPATKGSSVFYARHLHPFLVRREQEIDNLIRAFNSLSYAAIKNLFKQGFNLFCVLCGQVNHGFIELIKLRYNLREVTEHATRSVNDAVVSYMHIKRWCNGCAPASNVAVTAFECKRIPVCHISHQQSRQAAPVEPLDEEHCLINSRDIAFQTDGVAVSEAGFGDRNVKETRRLCSLGWGMFVARKF